MDMPTRQARGKKIDEMIEKMKMDDYSPEKLQS